jgi:prolyl-tRNA synthetase
MFLRTTEFLWQEGHTAHVDEEDAMRETMQMLEVYNTFANDFAAIPVITGAKTPGELFPGAVATYTIEGMMRDGRALQSGTSHYLGTNFAKMFNIKYTDENNELQLCHTTSWGVSTRMIGAVIMAHGDDKGLVLPPRLAPHQVVIVPIGKSDAIAPVYEAADQLAAQLKALGVRAHVDKREGRPGFKFNDWEMKGVPIKVELGPRDLESGQVMYSFRIGEPEGANDRGKATANLSTFADSVPDMLNTYHDALVERARSFREERTKVVNTWDEFVEQVKTGFASVLYDGTPETEDKIKAETAATPRCIPLDGPEESGPCFVTGKPSAFGKRVIFSRAY